MADYAFLSPSRRKVVNGDTDEFAESTVRAYRSETKHQAEMAINELIELSESKHVDTEDIFPPQKVSEFLNAVMDHGSITPPHSFDGDEAEHYEQYAYEFALYSAISTDLWNWNKRLFSHEPPKDRRSESTTIEIERDEQGRFVERD